ncbi:hypothetical protein LIX60_21655 [Streptomyces sp. S07_1.15]|uniref:hypothetical protein n=1 Tax=Streptomyces sp. S07_1.15 TaxID=2873925 RepID=UPI001D147424|nr:hypothetical protein [Streptomyces sp. S07_1.15]MCC3654022.1 hypothetical protein [Streptomyces sp. S07_1.15]
MTSIAERAHAAAVFLRYSTELSLYGRHRGEQYARITVRLAAALALHPDQITVTPDWLRRRTTPGEPVLATATCPDTGEQYAFLARSPLYDDEAFELLGPCPECSAPVPVAEIRHLADLGTHLARPPLPRGDALCLATLPDTFPRDEGHATACPYGETS